MKNANNNNIRNRADEEKLVDKQFVLKSRAEGV